MTAPRLLPPQPWMTAPPTRRLLAALGGDGTAIRFVGGCVRDALVGRASSDIDVATPDPPAVVMTKLAAAGLRAIPTGIEHGTVTALVEDRRFEVTTLRRDVATDGRHAEVAFTDDWRADAARRDFTFNALSVGPDGAVHDYFGGVADLEAGRVIFVGDPRRRIAEDYLRVLRFYRFHAWYGRGEPDPTARAACRDAAPALERLSGERVRGELFKLLAAVDPAPTVGFMAEDGVLPALSPDLRDVAALAALVRLEPEAERSPLRRLAALVPAAAAPGALESLGERLRLSAAEAARLLATRPALAVAAGDARAASLRRAVFARGAEAVADRLLLDAARGGEAGALAADLALLRRTRLPPFPLRGGDVVDRGVAPGPRVGAVLAAVEAWWIEQDFRPDRAACLERLAALVGGQR